MAVVDDLGYFLIVNLVWCDAVFLDEQQRFYIFSDLNLSNISDCRIVSLFDIRRKKRINIKIFKNYNTDDNIFSDYDYTVTNNDRDDELYIDGDSTLVDIFSDDEDIFSSRDTSINLINFTKYYDLKDNGISDSENEIYINIDRNSEKNTDINNFDSDNFDKMESDSDRDINIKLNIFSITDDRYLADNEKIRIIF
jgi:hypothetical protein